jgi:hypothetical protein
MKFVSRGATGLADISQASGVLARLVCLHARHEGVALAQLLRKANLTQRQLRMSWYFPRHFVAGRGVLPRHPKAQ